MNRRTQQFLDFTVIEIETHEKTTLAMSALALEF